MQDERCRCRHARALSPGGRRATTTASALRIDVVNGGNELSGPEVFGQLLYRLELLDPAVARIRLERRAGRRSDSTVSRPLEPTAIALRERSQRQLRNEDGACDLGVELLGLLA